MATVVPLYIKPEYFSQCVTDRDWWPSQTDGSANLWKDYSNFTSFIFPLLPLKHFLAHSLGIQVTVNLPKPQLDINIMAARWGWILCMVKTSGGAAGGRRKQEQEPTSPLAAPPHISNLSPLRLFHFKPLSPSVCLCLVIHFFHTEIRRFHWSDWGENIIVIVALRHLTSCKSSLAGLFKWHHYVLDWFWSLAVRSKAGWIEWVINTNICLL